MSGLDILHGIQTMVGPFWDQVFYWVTEFYSEDAYMAILPVLFLVADKRLARYFATVFLFNHWLNTGLKHVLDAPRPPEELWRPGFAKTAIGGGMPSGHSQGPLLFWGAVALEVQRRWVTVLVILVILAIGFSRLYGGVHWPADVLVGWTLGLLMLLIFHRGKAFMTRALSEWTLPMRLLPAVVVPVVTLAIFHSASDSYAACGAWLGLWVGSLIEERYVGYQARHYGVVRLVLHALLGVAVLFGLRVGLKMVLGESDIASFGRYILIGLAATLVVPWLCSRIPGKRGTGGRPHNVGRKQASASLTL